MARILLVTGGSRGIGAACACLAARQGYDVCINYMSNAARAADVAAEVEEAGRRVLAVQADVSRESEVVRLFEETDRALGTVTALVNNAGIMPNGAGPVTEVTEADLNRLWAVNLTGVVLCAREAVRRMSTAHGGTGGAIVNASSVAARIGGPGQFVNYAASKGAIDTFTLGLALEVANQGIRVNAVRPGVIDTEIHASGGMPNRVQEMAPSLPMGRAGSAEEVAESILWLLSDAASYVTGGILDVAGGR